MAQRKPKTLACDPFPQLAWGDDTWTRDWSCTDVIPGWAGFQSYGGDYSSADTHELGDGSINLSIASTEKTRAAPSASQIAAYKHLRGNAKKVATAILKRIFADYPALRSSYADYVEPDEMPEIEKPDDLRHLIGFSSVHLHRTARNGVSYAGIGLGCTWDDEHGLGAMLHKNRVVAFGGAETAILEWVAERDAKR